MDDNSVMNDSLNVNDLMEEQIYKHVEEDSRNKSFVRFDFDLFYTY